MSETSSSAPAASGATRRPALTGKIWANETAIYALRAIRTVLFLEVVLFFAATGLSYFKDIDHYPAFARVAAFQSSVERPASLLMKRFIPTNFKGSDISRWLFVFLVYVASTLAARLVESLRDTTDQLRRRRDGSESEGDMVDLQNTLQALARGETLDRKKLLQLYAETKKTLDKQKRHVAFLSIDVVNSTGMKVGETKETTERDFILYKKLVEKAINAHRCLKAAWTPDGVMICFASAEDAVGAGQDIVRALGDFNSRVKAMKHAFALRIGINAGEVSFEDTMPMEEMADRVIDITGHMQKHGTIDAVCVTKQAIEPLLGRFPDFKPSGRVVDGCEVYEWRLEA